MEYTDSETGLSAGGRRETRRYCPIRVACERLQVATNGIQLTEYKQRNAIRCEQTHQRCWKSGPYSKRVIQDFVFGRPHFAFAGLVVRLAFESFGDRLDCAFAGGFLCEGLLFEASKTSRILCSNASRVKGFARKEMFGLEMPCWTKGWSE